jgi:hypothetical protein
MFGSLPLSARERRSLTVIKLTGLAVFAAPVGVWAYLHYQQRAESERVAIEATAHQVKAMTARMRPDQLRQHLAEKYGTLVSRAVPQLSGVTTTVDGSDGKFSLHAEHPHFNQSSFSVGPLAPSLKRWTATNRDELRRAGIIKVRVGPHAFDTGAQAQAYQR